MDDCGTLLMCLLKRYQGSNPCDDAIWSHLLIGQEIGLSIRKCRIVPGWGYHYILILKVAQIKNVGKQFPYHFCEKIFNIWPASLTVKPWLCNPVIAVRFCGRPPYTLHMERFYRIVNARFESSYGQVQLLLVHGAISIRRI